MKFIERTAKFFNMITVKESGNQVKVTGVDGLILSSIFTQIWQAKVINKQMFSSFTNTSFSLNKFFIPDLVYMLIKIRENPKTRWSQRRTIDKIMHGILTKTWYKSSVEPYQSIIDTNRIKLLKWKPMPKQLEFLHLFGDRIPQYGLRGQILAFAAGGGKAQPLDALIRTTLGWTRMGDITQQHKAIMPDGSEAAITGIYPQGTREVFKVTFEDGRSTRCCGEHLWEVYHPTWGSDIDKNSWRVVSLNDLLYISEYNTKLEQLSIRLVEPHAGRTQHLSLDPYVFGYRFTPGETAVIPQDYLEGSIEQRIELLHGLLDSRGVEEGSAGCVYYLYNTNNLPFLTQLKELVRGLGGRIYTQTAQNPGALPLYLSKVILNPTTSLFGSFNKSPWEEQPKLGFASIDYVGEEEVQCISVDHPDHLYITDDYIVTHNTYTDLLVATCVVPPSVAEVKIIISPKKALHLVWEKSIKEVFNKAPTYWCSDSNQKMPLDKTEYYIFNFEQLDKAIELGKYLASKNIRYFVIVDESHNFADYRSARTQKLVTLQTIRNDIYFIWTSGSPVLKTAAELTSFLKCADRHFDDDAERRFKRIYAAAPGRANEIFNHRLGNMMAFIVPKTEFMTDKPTVKELPIKLPPSLEHKFLMSTVREDMQAFIKERIVVHQANLKQYRKIIEAAFDHHEAGLSNKRERQLFKEYQKQVSMVMRAADRVLPETLSQIRTYERTKLIPSLPPMDRKPFRNALSAIKNIKLKVRGEALGKVLATRRSECAATLALYCKPDVIMKESLSKTLFYSSGVLPVKVLEKYLRDKGFEPMLIYAGTNSDLTGNIERFTADPNINPICATMQSLSEAVPVTAASTVVLLNRPYRNAHWDQVTSRAFRLGQIHPVTIIEVTLDTGDRPNVSSTADAILANVRELISEIIGPDFAGPPIDERVYGELIDASKEDAILVYQDDKLGL